MYEQISANRRRSVLIIAAFVALTFAIAVVVTLLLRMGPIGIVFAAAFAIVSAFASYWSSDKVALAMSRARPADPKEYARYHNLVEGLCIAGGLPKPRLYIVDDPAPNAFATGRNPQHAAIAVTTGLLEKMNRVELEGVLAHELSHIKNYDILVMTIVVTMVGFTALLADFFARWAFWGGLGGGRDRRDDNNGSNPLGIVLAILGVLLVILAPIIARLMQLAMSRQREYLADASGVSLTRYPPGLIGALEKLKADTTVVHTSTKATAHLWIEEPLDETPGKKRSFDHLFATHPPIDDRIAALKEM
jgi:heat shock protein HtpX